MKAPSGKSISIHYEPVEGKRVMVVSGAYGGPSHDGAHVVAHVYAEWFMVPSIQQVPLSEEGTAEMDKATDIKRGELQREVQATLFMTPEVAVNIGKWLLKKGRAGLKVREALPKPDGEIRPHEPEDPDG